MNNQEIISRAISYNNSEINAVKSANDTLSKTLQRKEDKIIELNTDALAGLDLPGNTTYSEISGDILLGLFGLDNIAVLYYAISNFDNKLFVLKPTLESFNIGDTSYTITNCTPCIGKMIPYGNTRILMLTFVFNTVNPFTGIMTLFVDGYSIDDVRGRIAIDELLSELPDDISNTITALQGEVDTLKETSVTKTSLETTLGGYSTTGHTHSEYLTEHQDISSKQDVISDLETIRENAAKGAAMASKDELIFIGTQEEYETAYANGKIMNGSLVIILEQEELDNLLSSLVGSAIIGRMRLGTK